MFNLLVTCNETAWESPQRLGMSTDRFLEYSGDESASISHANPDSLKALERVQTLLMCEDIVKRTAADVVGSVKCATSAWETEALHLVLPKQVVSPARRFIDCNIACK